MDLNLDALHAVRDKKSSPREEWRPLTIDDLGYGIVICFDQSLTKTAGMCVHREGSAVAVRGVKQFAGHTDACGDEGNFQKGTTIYHRFIEFLMSMKGHHRDEQITVVHEAPPVGGGVVMRPESSLLAAQALRIAADRLDIPVAPMVSPAQHKKAICGNARADKPEAHAALAQLALSLPIRGYECVTNADKRDALCIGLTYLARTK